MKAKVTSYSLLATLVLSSYGFTWITYQSAIAADQGVKKEIRDQAKDVKKDLNDRINRLDQRINQALEKIQQSLDRGNPPPRPSR